MSAVSEKETTVDADESLQKRYASLRKRFENGVRLELLSIPELLAAGIKQAAISSRQVGGGELLANNTACAEYVRETYGRPCNKMDISRWSSSKRLPPGCAEKFPLADNSGRRKKVLVEEWCRKYLQPADAKGASQPLDDRSRIERAARRKAEMEADEMERSGSDKWIRYDAVKGYMAGAAQQISAHYDRLIEDKPGLRRLVATSVSRIFVTTPEQLLALDAELAVLFPSAVDELKATFETIGEDLQARISDLRKKEEKDKL